MKIRQKCSAAKASIGHITIKLKMYRAQLKARPNRIYLKSLDVEQIGRNT